MNAFTRRFFVLQTVLAYLYAGKNILFVSLFDADDMRDYVRQELASLPSNPGKLQFQQHAHVTYRDEALSACWEAAQQGQPVDLVIVSRQWPGVAPEFGTAFRALRDENRKSISTEIPVLLV